MKKWTIPLGIIAFTYFMNFKLKKKKTSYPIVEVRITDLDTYKKHLRDMKIELERRGPMITEILKDKELTDFLSSMVDDGCEVNLQVKCEVERYLKGNLSHEEMMDHLGSEWEFQRRQKNASRND